MQEQQNIRKRNPIVIEQSFLHMMGGIGPIVGLDSVKIKDNGTLYDITFDKEKINSIRISRKGALRGEVTFTDTPNGRVCNVTKQDRCTFIGLKNDEVIKSPAVIGSMNSENNIDSALHIGWESNVLSIMSGSQWAYLGISSMGLRRIGIRSICAESMVESKSAKIVFKTDSDTREESPVIPTEHTKSSLNTKKQEIFSMLGHFSKQEQSEMLNRFLSIVFQAKKRGHTHA